MISMVYLDWQKYTTRGTIPLPTTSVYLSATIETAMNVPSEDNPLDSHFFFFYGVQIRS